MIEIVGASPAHVGTVANRMRTADVEECRALGRSPKQALRQALISSTLAWTAKVDGRPEALFGLAPVSLLDGRGTPWMLGTDAIYRNPRALIRVGPRFLSAMLDSSRILTNVVSAGNIRAIRMLKAWGFEIGDETKMIGGVAFLDFRMERG